MPTSDRNREFQRRKAMILSGGPESVYDAGAGGAAASVRDAGAGARHLLRHADHGRTARRPGRVLHATANSAPRRSVPPARIAAARRAGGQSRSRGPPRARCLDEPRRPRGGAAARVQRDCGQRQRAAGGDGRRVARDSTRCSSIRGHPHPARRRNPAALRARDRRLRRELGHAATSSKTASRASARKSAATRCCWACPAGSIRRCWRRCCTGRSAPSSPACSWITDCCGWARGTRSWRPSPSTWA